MSKHWLPCLGVGNGKLKLPCHGVGNGKLKLPCLGVGNNGTTCLKNVKNCLNTDIYSYLVTTGG